MSTALPDNPYTTETSPIFHSAYQKCLDLEARQGQKSLEKPDHSFEPVPTLICARLLGFLLLYAPAGEARDELATDIVNCEADDGLRTLGENHTMSILQCFRPNRIRRDKPVPDLKDLTKEQYEHILEKECRTHAHAKLKALHRDGHLCMLSGEPDCKSVEAGYAKKSDSIRRITTLAAHIIDPSVASMIDNKSNEYEEDMNDTNLHELQNILTLDVNLGLFFKAMRFWFDRDPEDPIHCYRPGSSTRIRIPCKVQFTTPDETKFPLPDPEYLAVYAACAKSAHLSGLTEFIDDIYMDMSMTKILETDGSSMKVLHFALIRRADTVTNDLYVL